MKSPEVLAIVPARAGSKGVRGKNLRPLAGHSLIAYSVVAGLRCKAINRTVASTDSEDLAATARRYGAEVPFLRPAELADDKSPDIDYIRHALEWFEREENWIPDLVIQLRPTTPLRDPLVIASAIAALAPDATADSLRSAHELAESPHKMLQIIDGRFAGFFPDDPRPDYFNLPRQMFPKAYHPNGYVDICRRDQVMQHNTLYGRSIKPFITERSAEIDTEDDFAFLEWQLSRRNHPIVNLVREAAKLKN